MFISMLKKEIIQFLRNKGNVIMMFIFPIALITILGFALESMMSSSIDIFNYAKVYYNVKEHSKYEEGFEEFSKNIKKEFEDIEIEETNDIKKAKDEVNNNKAYALITIDEDGFEYFRNENGESTGAQIFRSIFEGVVQNYSMIDLVINNNPQMFNDIFDEQVNKYTKNIQVGTHTITSVDYYTFAELALIILYVSIIVGESVIKEKELKTIDRIAISKATNLKLILSKISLGIIIGTIQILIVYIYSTVALKANWGNNIIPMIINLLSLTLFASVVGAVCGIIVKDGKSLNGILNTFIIITCLLGGCYTPIAMIKSIPIIGNLTVISPIYWVNSALISLSTGVADIYTKVSLTLCFSISTILILIVLISKKLKGGDISA